MSAQGATMIDPAEKCLEIWIAEKCKLWASFMNFMAQWTAQVYTNTMENLTLKLH